MKTIAQQINWDFEANGDLQILDKNKNQIYYEASNGYWVKRQYDSKGNEIYYEHSTGYWIKREYDSEGNLTYVEYSSGEIQDNRIPQVIEHNGRKYQLIP